MALNFLSGGGSGSSAKLFDIRLDNDYIVFRGNEDEAASAQVQGRVVLCLTESMPVKHIKLTLSGINRMSWNVSSSSSMSGKRITFKERTFYEKSWTFRDPGKGKTETLSANNYEFPFDVILEGSLPESVEGLQDNWVIYRFKAEIGRKYAKDIIIRKPLRVVRTPDSSALELAHAMSVENVWPNKVDYTISTPTKAIAFGTAVQVDFRLVPLLKGLTIGTITTQVKEEQEFVPVPEFNVSACHSIRKNERVVVHDEHQLGPESDPDILDEEAEGYQFSRFLELPKSLNHCIQDCNIQGIKIRHKIKFNVQLLNPDGHVSELRANLPVMFYISPALPINENNDLIDQSPHATRQAVTNDIAHSAPPLYGEHQLDQLYSDVDPSGYLTPGNFSTPGTPYSDSRNISAENLGSLDTLTNGNGVNIGPGGHHVSADALQSRLQNLGLGSVGVGSPLAHEDRSPDNLDTSNDAEGMARSISSHNASDYFSSHSSSGQHSRRHSPRRSPRHSPPLMANGLASVPGSATTSRRPSAEDPIVGSGIVTPRPQFFHAEDLSRVPSYTTAVRTPPSRIVSSSNAGLPSYAATTAMAGPAPPESAYVRDRDRPAQATRIMGALQDDERRLRLLQVRGR